MLRRTARRLASTNRYTDGSGRKLESDTLPKDLYIPTISNRAYPVQGEHWQPVVADQPSPHKGTVLISGAGVVGLTVAAQFALRGWHTTVIERAPAIRKLFPIPPDTNHRGDADAAAGKSGWRESASTTHAADDTERERAKVFSGSADVGHYRGPLRRPHWPDASDTTPAPAQDGSAEEAARGAGGHVGEGTTTSTALTTRAPPRSAHPQLKPFLELECALVTRRAVDALEAAGVRLRAMRPLGVPVTGVLDHPGAYNTWLTRGLVEHHPFAVKMLSMDMLALRRHLEEHVEGGMPNRNLQVFYEHVVEAVYPLRQQVVVRPWHESAAEAAFLAQQGEGGGGGECGSRMGSAQDRTNAAVARAKRERRARRETSLTISSVKWEKKYADEAVDYDLLICAEGVNSHLRDLLDVEGFAADVDMGTRWFLLRADSLSHQHIHRWLHKRRTKAVTTAQSYHIRSAAQTPMTTAFPRVEGTNLFSVMVYAPTGELAGLADEDVLAHFLPDVAEKDPSAELKSFSPVVVPTPTVYCENLFNSVGLPSAVMVGDAGHHCHPFWMQGLALALEDGVTLLNQVDAYSRHFYDAVKQFSDERGTSGDALREMTDRCLSYERRKHANPLLRFQNTYQQWMNRLLPRGYNNYYEGSTNHVYSKTIEEMLNGRGYTSFDFAEKQQAKHRLFYHVGRLYT